MIYIDHDVILLNANTVGHRDLDIDISLMRNHPCDIVLIEAVTLGNGFYCLTHIQHGMLVNGATLLINKVLAGIYRLVAGHLSRTAGSHVKVLISLSVYTVVTVHKSNLLCGRLHHNTSCTITKDRTSVTVLIVGHAAHVVTTTDDDTLITSTTDIRSAGLHSIEETSTCSFHIKAESFLETAVANNQRGG